mmetsp:Transcript_2056/g.4910  ORF Transcript_2056/g.4910 Transcript_2056/m.4910 type:complete len:109 (-) Transcript_2056:260-586(-)
MHGRAVLHFARVVDFCTLQNHTAKKSTFEAPAWCWVLAGAGWNWLKDGCCLVGVVSCEVSQGVTPLPEGEVMISKLVNTAIDLDYWPDCSNASTPNSDNDKTKITLNN